MNERRRMMMKAKDSGIHIDPNLYVDLGLPSGNLYAKCNLGASNEWEAGNLYTFGCVTPYPDKLSPAPTFTTIEPDSGYDMARENLGFPWRLMESYQELNSDDVSRSWVTINGVYGLKVSNKSDSRKYVFFPDTSVIEEHSWATGIYGDCSSCAHIRKSDNTFGKIDYEEQGDGSSATYWKAQNAWYLIRPIIKPEDL